MSWLSRRLGIREPEHRVRVYDEELVPMRDGVRLRTQRVGPRDPGPHPAVLIRSPYGTGWTFPLPLMRFIARLLAQRGYDVVLQDSRGRYGSEGSFYPFVSERDDGVDSVEWIGKQSWFGGQLGMWGGSYLGYTQWAVAADAPEFLRVLVPSLTSTDMHGLFYPGGAFSLITALRWAVGNGENASVRVPERRLPAAARVRPMRAATREAGRPAGFFEDWCDHPEIDAYWAGINMERAKRESRVPALSIAGTYDIFGAAQIEDYQAMRESTWLELGPYAHGRYAIPARRLGWKNAGALRMLASSLEFLDHHLQGGPLERGRVRRYAQGEDRWIDGEDWPPRGARLVRLYLRQGGRLDAEAPGSTEPADRYTYDPADPVPTCGGTFLGPRCGPADQAPLASRPDVLIYETAPLERTLALAGPVRLKLFASTNAAATDFTGKLVQVPADSTRPSLNLCDGILRVGEARADPLALDIDLWHVSATIPAGDRLRLEVSSSNFPRFDAHPNIAGNPADATRVAVARQDVHHSADTPSCLELHALG